ncbi:MAG TPA: HAMP domain-containing sensor histidine kinase [Thermoanaerobaculia bacterium]|jgi:signal transduction histidine kinase|nr:HAMP domain-containing sensor histidine kinase [Thermoanaerobaculia bacterium]
MKTSRSAVAALISLAALAIAVVLLGTLQHRWIRQVADAERQRMRAGIEFAAQHYREDFDRDLTGLFFAFEMPLPEATPDHLLHRYDEWAASSRDPRIVKAVYFVPNDIERIQLIDPSTRSARPVPWPASLASVKPLIAAEIGGGPPVRPILPRAMVLVVPCGIPRVMMERHHQEMMGIHQKVMMMEPMPFSSFTLIELDRRYIARVRLPDLTRRYFDTPEGRQYEAAVVAPDGGDVLYRSDGGTAPFRADLSLPIFSVLNLRRGREEGPPMMRAELPHPPSWLLLVRYHAGSLEDIVSAGRHRNVMLTLGILAILAGTVIALLAMLRRAERLRLQQLEFVAGVTHELNTPVAALTSAGQNLADGIITEPSQVSRYGAAIVKESRRLTEMIGQVLAYGGMESRRKLPHVPVDVAKVIDEALASCRWMADEQSIAIEMDIDRKLPLVDGDAASLARAVQNLIANAIRHGAAGKWVGIRAAAEGRHVAISVEDRGPGIAARDLPHLFEPFYRGRGADRVRGSGLGLTIVKQIAAAHGGSVTIDRRRETGARFTLRLPVRPETTQHA